MKKHHSEVVFPFWGGEEKGEPGDWGIGLDIEPKEEGWLLIPRQGRKKPWMVRRCTKDLRSKKYHPQGGARHFKTKTNAENFIHRAQQSDMKEAEKLIGRLPAGARTTGQKAQDKARNKAIREWFPDTIALQEQTGHEVQTQEQSRASRKALAADMARLGRSIPKDILEGDSDFINTLVEAKQKANPFNPVVEELALNWLAHYSEDLPNEYGDKIRKKLNCEDSDAAIKGRVYRMGFPGCGTIPEAKAQTIVTIIGAVCHSPATDTPRIFNNNRGRENKI